MRSRIAREDQAKRCRQGLATGINLTATRGVARRAIGRTSQVSSPAHQLRVGSRGRNDICQWRLASHIQPNDRGSEKTKHTLKPGQGSEAWSRCRLDTDQARDAKKACITVGGLGAIYKRVNGTWQVPAGRKIKVVGVSTVRYYEWTKKKCGGKKNYPLK